MGLLAIYFTEIPDAEEALARLEHFLDQAAPALGRALRAERKTVGMLHAIERLTNLYDLSKAFGSTIDIGELSALIVRKAADLVTAEVATLWILEGEDVSRRGHGRQRELRRRLAAGCGRRGVRRRRRRQPGTGPSQPDPRIRSRIDREPPLPRPLDGRRAPDRRRSRARRPRRREQARAPSRVLARGRGAPQRPLSPGRAGAPHGPPARGREEGRRARRAARRQPRDHRDPRPRQGHAHDRQRDVGPDRLRPVRHRDPGRRQAAARGDLRLRRGGQEEPGRRGAWKSCSSGSSSRERTPR